MPTQKSWKRETSWGLLIVLFIFFAFGIWNPQAMHAAETLTAPVFLFAGGAFGLDAYAKQIAPKT